MSEIERAIKDLNEYLDNDYFVLEGGTVATALIALREQAERENPKPLTLDEIRQMDGEPIWCVDGEGHGCYCLVNAKTEDCIDNECGAWCFAFYGMKGDGKYGLHRTGWVAYRQKPKEEA